MLYFVPAWYAGNEWKEKEERWYIHRRQTETDDTVKQIQLFQRNSVSKYELLLLSYAPNFRHFLHRQGIFRASYWSVFDVIQEVGRKKHVLFSFRHLNWPKGIEFVYTPFSILAMSGQERYAQIEFGEDGNVIEVDLYKDGKINRKNQYDDRGFVSSSTVYEDGEMKYEQYLTDKGIWKLCHFADGHVAVNPRSNHYLLRTSKETVMRSFIKEEYESMEEVIEEVFSAYVQTTAGNDIFCIAAHERHLSLMDRLLSDRKTVYTVFENRLPLAGNGAALQVLSRGDCIVADSEENFALIANQEALKDVAKADIPPYSTRIDQGISRKLAVQKILFPVDGLRTDVLETAILQFAVYLKQNKNARVHLFTRNGALGRADELLMQVGGMLKRGGYPPEWAWKKSSDANDVNADKNMHADKNLQADKEEPKPVLFAVNQCVDDLSINNCVREQRVLVDLADTPDLFLQISGVSMGIPQIVKRTTRYVWHGENGRINRDILKLKEDLAYYLESLSNWNRAVIRSYEIGKTQTEESLIRQWKEVMDGIEKSKGIAAGKKGL